MEDELECEGECECESEGECGCGLVAERDFFIQEGFAGQKFLILGLGL